MKRCSVVEAVKAKRDGWTFVHSTGNIGNDALYHVSVRDTHNTKDYKEMRTFVRNLNVARIKVKQNKY